MNNTNRPTTGFPLVNCDHDRWARAGGIAPETCPRCGSKLRMNTTNTADYNRMRVMQNRAGRMTTVDLWIEIRVSDDEEWTDICHEELANRDHDREDPSSGLGYDR